MRVYSNAVRFSEAHLIILSTFVNLCFDMRFIFTLVKYFLTIKLNAKKKNYD